MNSGVVCKASSSHNFALFPVSSGGCIAAPHVVGQGSSSAAEEWNRSDLSEGGIPPPMNQACNQVVNGCIG